MPITGGPLGVVAITDGSRPVRRVYEGQNPVPIWPEPPSGSLYMVSEGGTGTYHVYTLSRGTGMATRGVVVSAHGSELGSAIAATWDGARIVAADQASGGRVLYSLNPTTGVAAQLHTYPASGGGRVRIQGLAWDGTTLFATARVGARPGSPGLYSVNTASWGLTRIGPADATAALIDWDGTDLYGFEDTGLANGRRFTLSRTTGAILTTVNFPRAQLGLVPSYGFASDGLEVWGVGRTGRTLVLKRWNEDTNRFVDVGQIASAIDWAIGSVVFAPA